MITKNGSYAVELVHNRDGESDIHTVGKLVGHGRYEIFAPLFFGGRRRRVFTQLAAASGARPGDRVLDVGCGTGYFTRVMARAVAPEGTARGVDPSGEAIAQANRLTRLANCTFSNGVAEALDVPDGRYDVVVSSLTIHHLPQALRPQAIGEMSRVLRPGGSVLVADSRPPATRLGRRLMRRHSPAMANNPVDLIEPLVRAAGFERVRSGDLRPWIHYVQARKPGRPGLELANDVDPDADRHATLAAVAGYGAALELVDLGARLKAPRKSSPRTSITAPSRTRHWIARGRQAALPDG